MTLVLPKDKLLPSSISTGLQTEKTLSIKAATGGALEKSILRNFAKFTGKHLYHSASFFKRL